MHRFYLLCITICLVYNFSASEGSQSKPSSTWEYLQFNLAWPNAFCSIWKCRYDTAKVKGWNIHGLWPTSIKGKTPENCKNTTAFNMTVLKPILNQLKDIWVNLKKDYRPQGLWEHEWMAHGGCAVTDPLLSTQLKYFNATIYIRPRFNLIKDLENKKIVPNNKRIIHYNDVHAALKSIYGFSVALHCYKAKDNSTIWIETRICLQPNLTQMNCPNKTQPIPPVEPTTDDVLYFRPEGQRYQGTYIDSKRIGGINVRAGQFHKTHKKEPKEQTFVCPSNFLYLEKPLPRF